jgi:ribosomal protein S20
METEEAGGKTPPEENKPTGFHKDDTEARKFAEDFGWSNKLWTNAQWGEKYGVTPQTISVWKRRHRDIIDRICAERKREVSNLLIKTAMKAIRKLEEQVDSLDEKVAQGAASKLLDKVAATQTEAVIREAVDLSALTDEELETASKLEAKLRDEGT